MKITENNYQEAICPACGIIDQFSAKWSLRVLVLLNERGTMRFNELMKATPGISQKMLTTTLRTLETHNLLTRTMYAEIPPRVEYNLSPLGTSLMTPLYALVDWTLEHADEITDMNRTH